jgi:outer membrane protein insertion porin family
VVNFKIEEGDIFTIKDIKIKGATLFKEEELKRVIQSSSGKIYSLKRIREDQYKIMEMYSKKGYIAVQIIPKPIIHKDLKMVSFEIEILEGEKCYLEKVTVSGNKVTEDKVILREVLLKPGDVFDGQKVSLTRQKLYQLGFFELVDMEIIPGSEKNKKLLNIKVKERKTGTITMGATWSNQYGFGATTEIAQNNLFGKGWKINFKGEFSKKRVDYRFGFINPWFYDTPTSLGVDIYNTTSKINLYKTTQKGGSISIGRPWKTFNKIYLDYRYERVLFSEVEENAPSDIKEREGVEETTSSFSLTFIRDTRDRIYHPSKGYRISFLNEFAGEILGGDVDYHKSILENRIYIPIFWKFVLAMRAKIGSIRSITGDEKVRDDFRFYLGGADSVRGYREEEIYLVDERGIEHGGNSFFLANIEYRFPLVKPLYFAFFFDMGNIWNRYNSIDLKNLKKGYGFYFLIETPMGPIRLDYGYPLDDKDKSEPEIYFSIGAPF